MQNTHYARLPKTSRILSRFSVMVFLVPSDTLTLLKTTQKESRDSSFHKTL